MGLRAHGAREIFFFSFVRLLAMVGPLPSLRALRPPLWVLSLTVVLVVAAVLAVAAAVAPLLSVGDSECSIGRSIGDGAMALVELLLALARTNRGWSLLPTYVRTRTVPMPACQLEQ